MNKKHLFFLLAFVFAVMVLLAYSNHFHNSFHFDDSHVIQENMNIRSIDITRFLTDASTFSALPANQSYRPLLTTLFAIEYWMGDGVPLWFHIGSFFCYMMLWVLLFLLFKKIFALAEPNVDHGILALIVASFYILHTANAETVNYISAGSDLLSTTLMVGSIALYDLRPGWRKFGLYLLPAALAMLAKEVSAVFPLFLFMYIVYEKNASKTALFEKGKQRIIFTSLIAVVPAILVCISLLVISSRMLPSTFVPSNFTRLEYALTQPFVILYYFTSFFLPFNLSADTDWETIKNVLDQRVLVGIIFIAFLFVLAIWTFRKESTRPIAFGIFWFLIGVLPPSSGVVVLSEVMNDHRMFLPFIGLAIASGWALALFVQRNKKLLDHSKPRKAALLAFVVCILSGHAYGTYQRNKVWKDEESLWYDVTQKSPKNGRGLMNYGLALMTKGETQKALFYFEKALTLSPNYSFLHINKAVALDALGDVANAEKHFKRALECDPRYHGCYYYYSRFLDKHGRQNEALPLLVKAVALSPGFPESRYLLMRINAQLNNWNGLRDIVEDTLKRFPHDQVATSFQQKLNTNKPMTSLAQNIE